MAAITTYIGTMAETILTMYLFGSLWDRWTLAFKITTPMLHLLFMSAQLWGTWCLYKMYQKQGRLIAMREGRTNDLEAGTKDEVGMNPTLRDGSEIELTEHSRH
jgi:hypothetical protein